MTGSIPPIAICSRQGCNFRIELQDTKNGKAVSTPEKCSKCGAETISICPNCDLLLWGNPDIENAVCAVCRCDIRHHFQRRKRITTHPASGGPAAHLSNPVSFRSLLGITVPEKVSASRALARQVLDLTNSEETSDPEALARLQSSSPPEVPKQFYRGRRVARTKLDEENQLPG
jgi:hypothetical protein